MNQADIRKINERDCQRWLFQFQQRYAPTVVNNSTGTLRAVFQLAVDAGARFENPTANLKRLTVRQKHLQLPTREQFDQFVNAIETAGAPQSADCAALVRFLAYSGLRISESWFVAWGDVDFKRKQLLVRGSPVTATKNDEVRVVPFIRHLEEIMGCRKVVSSGASRTAQSRPILAISSHRNLRMG